MAPRTVKREHKAVRDDIADLQTRRPVPSATLDQVDPFLFLNHHGPQTYPPNNSGLPFGPHPHRGFETVTFILAGDLMHKDSGGHESVIRAGGVQWMTAGRGLIHAELSSDAFMQQGGPLEILQLWVNLPGRLKMVAPRYTGLQKEEIPSYTADDGRVAVNLISGDYDGHTGPIASHTDIHMMTVVLAAGGRVGFPVASQRAVFLYTVRGSLLVGGRSVPKYHLVEMNHDGDEVVLEATEDTVLLFGHGEPYQEPVIAHGPFVMNTREEIVQAFNDYQAGKFGPSL